MNVRHTPLVGGLCVATGIFMFLTLAVTGNGMMLLLGILQFVVGAAMLMQPTVVVSDHEVQHRNLLGMTLRRVSFQSFEAFELGDAAVYVVDEAGSRHKVAGRMLSRGSDYEALVKGIREHPDRLALEGNALAASK